MVWAREVAERHGSTASLAQIPASEWDDLVPPGIDMVWLLGVWTRSGAGREIALGDPVKAGEIAAALPDWTPLDVAGSPFSIREYVPEAELGGWEGLDTARGELARRGARLMLDWVPNHMGPDSPWLVAHPDAFMPGSAAELAEHPEAFIEVAGQVFARGRDPYFPPWPDVVQVNAFSPQLRQLAGATLAQVATHCDAVRADMSMLMLDDVVTQLWGTRGGTPLPTGYWEDVLAAGAQVNPGFRFIAEVYWGREAQLQRLGMSYCYDKTLLDLLEAGDAAAVSGHVSADPDYQSGLVRFIENHDEARAATALQPWKRQRAASVIVATLPGMSLWHEGQSQGRRVWLPVFLARRPQEVVDLTRQSFHLQLWWLADEIRHSASWSRLVVQPSALLAWQWVHSPDHHAPDQPGPRTLVIINYSQVPIGGTIAIDERLAHATATAQLVGDAVTWQLDSDALHVSLGPWDHLVLQLRNPR